MTCDANFHSIFSKKRTRPPPVRTAARVFPATHRELKLSAFSFIFAKIFVDNGFENVPKAFCGFRNSLRDLGIPKRSLGTPELGCWLQYLRY
ncbi:MAG: hypothetical protein LBJ67_02085 [Planctomycetaceae bacterium]|jgi:hypothetical protein|nr:hypothetical protein [Planctomycetaceae bacterium]